LNARQLTRDMATGGTVWWMPTTKEFGPNGSYDDWEYHEKLATRFGVSTARSRENRFNQNDNPSPDNTQVRLADSLLLFQTGALASDITVQTADFRADGPLPVASIHDSGFYVQGAFYPIKKKLEVYGATSWIFSDKDAGFNTSHEYIQGANCFPFDTRNHRVNFQVIEVDRSPVSSLFGFYVGGQKGTTISIAMSVLF
jgi:hypothetical protein